MAKYKLKASNVVLCGKLFKREDNHIFDTEKMDKKAIEDSVKAGFLIPLEEKKTAKQIVEETVVEEKAKAKAEAKK